MNPFPPGSLPDELVTDIISDLLSVSDTEYFCMDSVSPFAVPSKDHSTSFLLFVCKQWMRVATPALYNCIIIRSKAQAQSLAAALKNTPWLGTYIKRLRVEGGFGNYIHEIITSAPNICDFVMTFEVLGPDNPMGLAGALHTLKNMKRLGLMGLTMGPCSSYSKSLRFPKSKSVKYLLKCFEKCLETHWTSLRTLYYPFPLTREYGLRASEEPYRSILSALPKVPGPLTVYVLTSFRDLSSVVHFLNLNPKGFRQIIVAPPGLSSPLTGNVLSTIPDARYDGLQGRVKFLTLPSSSKDTAPTDSDELQNWPPVLETPVTVTPLSNVSQDTQTEIWTRIIAYAADSQRECVPQPAAEKWTLETGDRTVGLVQARLWLVMVNKLIYRIGLPFLYEDLELWSPSHLLRSANFLLSHQELGQNIRRLRYRPASASSSSGRTDDLEDESLKSCLKSQPFFKNESYEDLAVLSFRFILSIAPGLVSLQALNTSHKDEGGSRFTIPQTLQSLNSTRIQSLDLICGSELRTKGFRAELVAEKFNSLKHLVLRSSPGYDEAPGVSQYRMGRCKLPEPDAKSQDEEQIDFKEILSSLVGQERRDELPTLESVNVQSWDTGGSYYSLYSRTYYSDSEHCQGISFAVLSALSPMRLPALTALDFTSPRNLDRHTKNHQKATLAAFLHQHGRQLKLLRIHWRCKEFLPIALRPLDMCPILEKIVLVVDPIYRVSPSFFASEKRHMHLKKIEIMTHSDAEESDKVAEFLNNFGSMDFSPLKGSNAELQVDICTWPLNEREIRGQERNGSWIVFSKMLRDDDGMKLTDSHGAHWVERLGS